jgi:AcrR family transcriptional regulator
MAAKQRSGRTGRPAKVVGEVPTRQKIFDTSIDLFAKKGYDRTTIRDIAHTVGISESAVYRHYESKDAILEAIFDHVMNQVFAPLPTKHAPEEASIFRQALEGLPQYIGSNPQLVKILHILLHEMNTNDKVREYLRDTYGTRADEYTEDLFRKEMEEGRIRQCDVKALTTLFNAFRFAWLFQTFIIEHGPQYDIDKIEGEMESQIKLFEKLTAP